MKKKSKFIYRFIAQFVLHIFFSAVHALKHTLFFSLRHWSLVFPVSCFAARHPSYVLLQSSRQSDFSVSHFAVQDMVVFIYMPKKKNIHYTISSQILYNTLYISNMSSNHPNCSRRSSDVEVAVVLFFPSGV